MTDPEARGLLLDIGGVVLRTAVQLTGPLREGDPRVAAALDGIGGIGSERDALWQQMQRKEITERDYWRRRAASIGAAIGEQWTTRDLIDRLYHDNPRELWLNQFVLDLMHDVKAAGLQLGALTNDLADFHGAEWVRAQDFLAVFDVIVDASHTGIMKPDPRAFRAGAEALGLPPERLVYLDDMAWNVVAGRAVGLLAVQVSADEPQRAVDTARTLLRLPRAESPDAPA